MARGTRTAAQRSTRTSEARGSALARGRGTTREAGTPWGAGSAAASAGTVMGSSPRCRVELAQRRPTWKLECLGRAPRFADVVLPRLYYSTLPLHPMPATVALRGVVERSCVAVRAHGGVPEGRFGWNSGKSPV